MVTVRPRASLHHVEGGWFSANWHFSFDDYNDPENTWFGDLRVFNDDRLIPGAAWPMHPHRDIEGITYVAEGTFEHADSRGNGGILMPGSIQRATLGSGMQHSEPNGSKSEPMRFIQMWIIPARRGLEPSVAQHSFPEKERTGRYLPVLIPAEGYGGADAPKSSSAVTVHQDAAVYATLLPPRSSVTHRFRSGFGGYFFVVHGEAVLTTASGSGTVDEGGAATIMDEPEVTVKAGPAGAEALLVETKISSEH
ncbi:MAG: pirin family protein [Candidatus Dormibacteraeota bacterium]|nr:pirin family protein [Candidatus Dormibacteraeota bacterium]